MSKKSIEIVLSELKDLLSKDARDAKADSGDLIMGWQEFQGSVRMYVRLALNKDVDNATVSAIYKAGKERRLWNCTKPGEKDAALFIHTKPREEVDVDAVVNSLL